MKWAEKISKWNFSSLKINMKFAEMEFTYTDTDEIAAWEMYVELITRISINTLPNGYGNEKAALESIYSLFSSTRELLKLYGRKGQTFSKLAVIILNQTIRPFTVRWHNALMNGVMDKDQADIFRSELEILQVELSKYAKALAEIANVEDISDIDITTS